MPDFALSITTTEPLFFRDGRPATTNDAVFSSGQFPPSPSVLYGALRGSYFSDNPTDFPLRNTEDDPTNLLTISTLLVQSKETRLFQLPADLVLTKNSFTVQPLHLRAADGSFISNYTSPYYLTLNQNTKVAEGHYLYLTEADFAAYMLGQLPVDYKDIRDYTTRSARMGIARNHGVVREGALFRFDRTTLTGKAGPLSFYVAGQGLDWPINGRLELGSDGTLAFYHQTNPIILSCPPVAVGEILKVVITTPGLFEAGWHPSILLRDDIEILACAIGKAYGIGGFDMKTNTPKTMYRAVPAGAVYVVRALTQTGLDTLTALHGQSWSDFLPEQGFGLGYLAKALPTQHD